MQELHCDHEQIWLCKIGFISIMQILVKTVGAYFQEVMVRTKP
jgi:hypothetical protein